MGERHELMNPSSERRVGLDTYAGKIHVEWDPQAAVTPLGQLPFFISFLKVSGLYDDFVASYPLSYTSPNAPANKKGDGFVSFNFIASLGVPGTAYKTYRTSRRILYTVR